MWVLCVGEAVRMWLVTDNTWRPFLAEETNENEPGLTLTLWSLG